MEKYLLEIESDYPGIKKYSFQYEVREVRYVSVKAKHYFEAYRKAEQVVANRVKNRQVRPRLDDIFEVNRVESATTGTRLFGSFRDYTLNKIKWDFTNRIFLKRELNNIVEYHEPR